MAAPDPSDLPDILEERYHAEKVDDLFGQIRYRYQDWQTDLRNAYAIYRNDWKVVWPDGEITQSLPMVPNFMQLAADSRSKAVSATNPTLLVAATEKGDRPRALADKQERIFADWLWRSRVFGATTQEWAMDAMAGGLTVCRVWSDFDKPRRDRTPRLERIKPMYCYPSPIFTRGPNVDSMLVTWEERLSTIQLRYPDVDLMPFQRDPQTVPDRGRVIEFYDDRWYLAIIVGMPRYDQATGDRPRVTLSRVEHGLGCVPVTIGSRITLDGPYRGEFNGGFGIMNYWNRLMTLVLDDATQRVYDSPLVWNVQDADEYGPGVTYEAEAPDAFIKFPDRPNQSFSNFHLMDSLASMARTMNIFPPSSSGDPNESIISAAGISATQSPTVEDVRSIQSNILTPMLSSALEIGVEMEKVYGYDSRRKPIRKMLGSYPGATAEPYTANDLAKVGKIQLRYGIGAGLDPINTNVMVLQQFAGGGPGSLISKRTAQIQSPFVEDPQGESRQQLVEQLDQALTAGVLSNAAQGLLSPEQLAAIRRDAESDEPLHDIVARYAFIAPVEQPTPTGGGPGGPQNPAAPGIAGAQGGGPGAGGLTGGPAEPPAPPLEQLLGIAPQTRSARRGG